MACVKMTGADLKAFAADQSIWEGDSWWLEEDLILVDGVDINEMEPGVWENVADEAVVEVRGGLLTHSDVDKPERDLVKFVRRWLLHRNSVRIVIEVLRKNEAAVRESLRAQGLRVVS